MDGKVTEERVALTLSYRDTMCVRENPGLLCDLQPNLLSPT